MPNPEELQVIQKAAFDDLLKFMKDNEGKPVYVDRVLPKDAFSPFGLITPLPRDEFEYNPYLHDLGLTITCGRK